MRKRINITLNETTYDKIKELAEADRRSISNKIECIVEDYLKNPHSSTTTPVLSYPPGVRGIPETPYEVTAGLAQTPIISTPTPTTTFTTTTKAKGTGSKQHPLVWMDENQIDPMDVNEPTFELLRKRYPEVTMSEFITYQHQRQDRYIPDPNDPMDPMTNNPYLKNK